MDTVPICQAQSKQSGKRCCNYAVRGRVVCHIHGGKTPKHNSGPKTQKGKSRQKMASWKHGMRSKEAIMEAREFRQMTKEYKDVLANL